MSTEHSSRASVQRSAVPWLIGAAALVVYFLTLNWWISVSNSSLVLHATGWGEPIPLMQPLLHLLTLPLRWLPATAVPAALNGLTAILAALTLMVLARSVMLLPQDRTRDQRMRERAHGGLLSITYAWVPPVLAVLVCGLELTFWRNAISATGEMLDLLIFATLIYCLLRFRLSRNDRWLFVFTFLYGLGTANNYALMGFFPAFFVAFVWMKGMDILNTRFLLISIGLGLAGLCLYLVLPLLHVLSDQSDLPFWLSLKSHLVAQKNVPQYFLLGPRYYLIALSLASLVPIFLFGIRWSSSIGDTNALSVSLRDFMFYAIHLGFFAVCLVVAFNPRFGTYEWVRRDSQAPLPFLTLYYLGALVVGYCAGYIMLVFGREPTSATVRSTLPVPKAIRVVLVSLVWLALIAVPAGLIRNNLQKVRAENSPALRDFASVLANSLPAEGGVALSDEPLRLLLLHGEFARSGRLNQWLLLDTRRLAVAAYNRQLHRVYPNLWPEMPNPYPLYSIVPQPWLVETIAALAEKRPVFYLHPSFGYYFEAMYPEPSGLAVKLARYPVNSLTAPPLSNDRIEATKKFWSGIEQSVLQPLYEPVLADEINASAAGFLYSRTLNWWGAQLQMHGQLAAAGKTFGLATNLNPENLVAQTNSAYNALLQKGAFYQADLPESVEDTFGKSRSWEQVLMDCGPFDEPRYCFRVGQIFFSGNLIRQAGQQFLRTIQLRPDHVGARLSLTRLYLTSGHPTNAIELIRELRGKTNEFVLNRFHRIELNRLEITTRLTAGETNTAERLISDTYAQGSKDGLTLGMLAQIRLSQDRLEDALKLTEELLQLRPDDSQTLLNKSALLIQLKRPEDALPILAKFDLASSNSVEIARLKVAAHLVKTNTWEALERLISEIYAHGSKDPATLAMLAEARLSQNRTEEALKLTDELVKLRPNDPEVLLNKTALLIQLNRPKEALTILNRLLAQDQSNDKALLNRAIAYLKAKDYSAARRDYESLLKRYPDYFNIHFGLGEVGFYTNDKELALRNYRRYLTNAPPGTPEALEVEARIKKLEADQ